MGFLGYRPPAAAAQTGDDGVPTWVVVAAVAVGVIVLAAALAVPFLRADENVKGRAFRPGPSTFVPVLLAYVQGPLHFVIRSSG